MSDELPTPSAVERVLAECFLLREEGQDPDLEELCEGDPALRSRVEKLLDGEPELLRRQAASSGSGVPLLDGALFGTRLDDFRILERIASGGSGTVFLAEQERIGRQVALKVVDKSRLGSPQASQRLRREAAIAGSLHHPNIVPIYAVGEEGDRCFIAMRHLAGPPLSELDLPLEPKEAARLGLALAEALDAAHAEGIVHRDVKPANVLLESGVPYLVDFGLARSSVDPTLTDPGAVPGTLPYMAPELLSQEGPALDPRADVYALGMTLYELLSGRLPFLSPEPVGTVRKILLQEPPALNLPRAHRDLETIVHRALEKEPRRRLRSARLFAEELRRYLDDRPILSRPTGRIDRALRQARRRPRQTAFALAALLAVVSFAGVALWSQLRERQALDAGLKVVETALDEGRLPEARGTRDELAASHGGDGAIRELARRVSAEEAVDELFGLLYQRPLFLDGEGLERGLAALDSSAALELLPERAGPLRAVALDVLGRPARGSDGLTPAQDWSEDSTTAALLALLEGRDFAEQERLLDLAFADRPRHPRAAYTRGVLLASHGRLGEAIRAIESRLDPVHGSRDTKRLLVRLRTRTGAMQEARGILDSIPAPEWGEVEAFHDLELLLLNQAWDDFLARLELHRERYPSPALIDLAEAQYLATVGRDRPAARALLERLAQEADDPALRDLAAASAFRLGVEDAVTSSPGSDLRPWVERGEELWGSLDYARARGLVAWKVGVLHLFTGNAALGFARLEQAMELLPGNCLLRAAYAEHCLSLAQAAPGLIEAGQLEAGTGDYLSGRARAALGEVADLLRGGDAYVGPAERGAIMAVLLRVVEATNDWHLLDQFMSESNRGSLPEGWERVEAEARAAYERLYGPEGPGDLRERR